MNTTQVKAYGAADKDADLKELNINRRAVSEKDI